MASSISDLIYQEALARGVPPSIALAVAQQESGVSQWTPSGGLVTGTRGEVGVFQIMPGTAAGLGVDPADLGQNISGGVSYLAQLFDKFGNWASALSAYNSGSPTRSLGYANSVLAKAGISSAVPPVADSSPPLSPIDLSGTVVGVSSDVWIIGGLAAAVSLVWWLED